jgi:hypothetical protein
MEHYTTGFDGDVLTSSCLMISLSAESIEATHRIIHGLDLATSGDYVN